MAGLTKAGVDHFEVTKAKLKAGAVPLHIPVNCVKFLISPDSNGLNGKTISASFDNWETKKFKQSIDLITNSDLYTLRRINISNLDVNNKLRKDLTDLGDKQSENSLILRGSN